MWYLQKIPKIAYFYWGNDTISFLRYLSLYSFRKYNPDWQVKLFVPVIKYQGENTWNTWEHPVKFHGDNYMDRLFTLNIEINPIDLHCIAVNNLIPETFKSDILRWHLLSNYGGLWSDMDIIYFRSINHLTINQGFSQHLDTIVCLAERLRQNSIGFLLSAPENPFYHFMENEARLNLNCNNYQSTGADIFDRYFPSMDALQSRFPELNFANLDLKVVYPINVFEHDLQLIFNHNNSTYITLDSIGMHWYAGHPAANQFENIVTEHNFRQFDNVIAKVIGWVID